MAIKWNDLNRWSLVLVEFGNHVFDIDANKEDTYSTGLNIGYEFCYLHMAIVVSNPRDTNIITVLPLTTYKHNDENYKTNIVIDIDKFGHMVDHKTTIKAEHLKSIDKKKRVKKIIKGFVSKTLQEKIRDCLKESICG